MTELGLKTERKWMKVGAVTFVFIFFYRTPETNMEMITIENKTSANTTDTKMEASVHGN